MNAEDVLYVLTNGHPEEAEGWVFTVIADDYYPFEKGELLILDGPSGREVFGEGRKPAKWSVDDREFTLLADALAFRASLPVVEQETNDER